MNRNIKGLKDHEIRELTNTVTKGLKERLVWTVRYSRPPQCLREVVSSLINEELAKQGNRVDHPTVYPFQIEDYNED